MDVINSINKLFVIRNGNQMKRKENGSVLKTKKEQHYSQMVNRKHDNKKLM